MTKKQSKVLPLGCGIITCGLHFYIIPQFFMGGLADPLWVVLMLLLPILPAIVLLYFVGHNTPKSIFWSLLAECLTIIIFHRAIGVFLGYRLASLTGDLFDFIAYFMFTLGFAISTALVQFVCLSVLRK